MPQTASDIARKIVWQKLSYAQKTLSNDAIFQNYFTISDVFDLASFFGDFVLSDTLFSSLMSAMLFDINPSEISPWSLAWDVELPTPDEYVRGVLIKLVPVDVSEQFPWMTNASAFVWENYLSEYAGAIESTRLYKGYFDESYFDQSYFDPTPVREFLRSTMYAFTKKGATFDTARQEVLAVAKNLGIDYEMASDIFRRLSMMTLIKSVCATADYSWVDVSEICEEGSEGHAYYIDLDGSVSWVEYTNIDDATSTCFADASIVDFCYVAPDKYPFKVIPEKYVTEILDAVDYMVFNFRDRLFTTALAVGNYQKYEEREKPQYSLRTEQYGESRLIVSDVERKVEILVTSMIPDIPPIKLRMYKVATLSLYSNLSSSNKWGADMYKAMDIDTLRSQWIDEWSNKGLDRNILEKIWNDVWQTITSASSRRFRSSAMRYLMRGY